MTKAEEKLQKLELKRRELEAKIQREKARLSSAARKADTRRKVLVGAALIAANTAGDPRVPDELLAQILDAYITDAKARAFLGLDAPASGDDSADTPAPLPADGGGQEMRPSAASEEI
jgi:septal ring factor EnvC (AmiA/AmiB activator)